jgi:hypothetical protein
MTFFETTVDFFEEFLGEGWVKEQSEDETVFSKAGQAISFIVRSRVNAPRFRSVECVAKKTRTLRKQVTFIGGPWLRPIQEHFKGYKTQPVYDRPADAIRVFIESVL